MTIIEVLDQSVEYYSEEKAIHGNNFSFTYKEFYNASCHFASYLAQLNIKPGMFVGICLERTPEMLVGIYGILRAGAAYVPTDPLNPPNRILSTFEDANIKYVVTTANLAEFVSNLGFVPIVPEIITSEPPFFQFPNINPSDNAYVLFTSGSTGTPKGVMVGHNSVVNLINYIQNRYPLTKGDVVLLKSPYTFDGSIWELFGWMSMGAVLFVSAPGAEKDPTQLLQIIDNEKVSFLFFVPSMLSAFLEYFSTITLSESCSSLKWISVGGEVVPVSLVNRFYQLINYESTKLINVYGPTETCVYATTYLCQPILEQTKIPIGEAVTNDIIYILDENFEPVTPGTEGEICIGGAGVANGYLNRPELTAEMFVDDKLAGKGKMYRTGDIGKQLDNGFFDFIGRRDFQVKLRGLRIEMGEIEHALQQIPELLESLVVFSKDRYGDDCLIAYLKLANNLHKDSNELFYLPDAKFVSYIHQKLGQFLPAYMIPSEIILCSSFPLTIHGKIDRQALISISKLSKDIDQESFTPTTELEEKLYEIWKKVLGRNAIAANEEFFAAGGHSLKAIQIITSLIKELNCEIPLKEFYNDMTLPKMTELLESGEYAQHIDNKIFNSFESGRMIFPLTPVQAEMWVMNNLDETGITHNIQVEFGIKGNVDIELFINNIKQTIRNEETFRSVFPTIEGKPTQQILDSVEVEIPTIDLSNLSDLEKDLKYQKLIIENGDIIFSFDTLPLFSFYLIKWSTSEYRLLMAVHHLIFDGWSLQLFMKRVIDSYKGFDPEKSIYRNGDYALLLEKPETKKSWEKELAYWKNTLQNPPIQLNLPLKTKADIDNAGKYGNRYWWNISKSNTYEIEQLAIKNQTTPFVILMSAFQLALSSASGQNDIVVGTPYANRKHPMTTNLIGYFTNMVSIRTELINGDTLISYIMQCNEKAIGAFSNASIPFGEVAKQQNTRFPLGKNPIFQVIFVMQNWPHEDFQTPEFSFTQREIGNNTAKIDLMLNIEKRDDEYICWIEFDTMLYDEDFIAHISDGINYILAAMVATPLQNIDITISQITPFILPLNKLSCIVVGEGTLPQKCIEILKTHHISVHALISKDDTMQSYATELNIPFFKDVNYLNFKNVDLIFSINNGLILKKEFTGLAKIMAVNYHDAPLPKYAGLYAPNWAILNYEKKHGVTWHLIADEIDAGDIVASQSIDMFPDDTVISLNTRCYEAAVASFEVLIEGIVTQNIHPIAQNLIARSYNSMAARPENFGLITSDMHAKSIDALIRATNFCVHYPNEFTLPLLFVKNEYYVVAEAKVVFEQVGIIGQIVSFEGNKGFHCADGLVIPIRLYNNLGKQVEIDGLLEIGSKMPDIDKSIAKNALNCFADMARFESYWRKQLSNVEYLKWPIESGQSITSTTKVEEKVLAKINAIFPTEKTDDVLSAIIMLYILRLSNLNSGTVGFISENLSEKIKNLDGFFNSWVPLNISIEPNNLAITEIKNILITMEKAKRALTFSISTRIRYPELKKTASEQPEIIISKVITKNTINNECITINVINNEISYRRPEGIKLLGSFIFMESFETFLNNVFFNVSIPINELATLSNEKSLDIIKNINQCNSKFANLEDVYLQFMTVSETMGYKTAIVDNDKNYLYSTFSQDIQNLSANITAMGIVSGQAVGVLIGRNYNYFKSIMAILHCGAHFVSIDPSLPLERKKFMCADAEVALLLIDTDATDIDETLPSLNVNETKKNIYKPKCNYNADSVAYIIYTSGSTGIPKGVKISRKSLASFISGAIELYPISSKDRVLQFSNLSFDASIEEIFCSFCTGASLFLRTEELLIADELLHFSTKNEITVWDLPTAFWRQVIQSESYKNQPLPPNLQLIIIGGEAITNTDVSIWKNKSHTHRLFNTYGPTETTVVALAYEILRDYTPKTTVPIGRPLVNYHIYITNSMRQLVPEGVKGELLIAGDCLALGYQHREVDENNAFIWIDTPDKGLQRCYCTGDLVLTDQDGLIYYQGRVDSQVKIRGYRIEPSEIEQQICLIEGIETCVVVVAENAINEKSIYAFYITKGLIISEQSVKNEIKKVLPAYMIPEIILNVKNIPLTNNGKVDKKQLMNAANERLLEAITEKSKPTNETEEYILQLWKKILMVDSLGIDDDFFDFGGHSLKAVCVMAEIKKHKGINLPLASLIQNSTVRKFAPLLTKNTDNYWHCLVPIRTQGKKTPIFIVHGAGLNVLLYSSLSQHLKSDRPIYAFQAKGLDGKQKFATSLEEMSEDYILEMKKIQPTGPYMLLGFSLGGFVAFEMARKLTENGDNVCFTGIIDAPAFLAIHTTPIKQKLADLKITLNKPFYTLWLFLKEPWAEKWRFVKIRHKSIKLTMKYLLVKFKFFKPEKKLNSDEKKLFMSDTVMFTMHDALIKYIIKPAAIQIDLFKAGKVTFYILNRKDYGWSKFCLKGMVTHTLAGEHTQIFAPPNDKNFAEILDKRLAEIEANILNTK